MSTSQTIDKINSSNIDDQNWSITTEKGWECPRCGRINAPWVRQCDCTRGTYDYNKWTITPTWTDDKWWKTYITCTQADANTYINKDKVEIGGSDY